MVPAITNCKVTVCVSLYHRCFADNKPRTFDDSSLRILCNFSEIVVRELERDIALAEAREKEAHLEDEDEAQEQIAAQTKKSQPLLRSLECVTR